MTDRIKSIAIGCVRLPRFWSALVFCLAVGALLSASAAVRSGAPDDLYLQGWKSDEMMQTLPSRELRRDPFGSLWYLHKQPPGLDAIRAVLANLAPDEADVSRFVDIWMHRVWAVLYGIAAVLIFRWVRRRSSVPVALLASTAWLLHPAAVFYATILEGTGLSALLVLWFFFELREAPRSRAALIRLTLAAVLLVYTRSVFQWYFVPVFAACVLLRGVPARRAAAAVSAMIVLTGLLFAKQYLVFGTTATSTFTGYHHCGVIWYEPTQREAKRAARKLTYRYPEAARRRHDEHNTRFNAYQNLVYTQICRDRILEHPAEALAGVRRSIMQNVPKYFQPSSRYWKNVLVDALPWRALYDFVFSGWMLAGLFAVCVVVHVSSLRGHPRPRDALRAWAAYAIVFVYVFSVSNLGNRYQWVETNRIKFLLEPVFFVFLVSSIIEFASQVSRYRRGRSAPERESS